MTPTTYGRDFAYCLKSHGGVRGFNASLWRFLLRCTLFCHSVATFLTSVSSYEGGCGFEANYKIVEKNDFAFNPARINVGSIARLTTLEKGIVSPMYICFRTQENVAPEYIDFFFESKHFYCEIQKRLEGSVRQCLSFEGLCNIPISLPSLEMQQRIGKRLFTLEQKIKTETDLLELLNKQKQYLLRQMFI